MYVIILYVYIIDEYCDLLNWIQVNKSVNKNMKFEHKNIYAYMCKRNATIFGFKVD